jgi:hypothetical protein
MKELSIEDLREIEETLGAKRRGKQGARETEGRKGA